MTTTDPPTFFVPHAEDADAAWESLRQFGEQWLGRPLRDRKMYALGFVHDRIGYEARVGEPRHATKYRTARGKVDYNSPPQHYDDGPEVVAIFQATEEGGPFLIFDAGQGSSWNNPQIVGAQDVRGSGRDFSSA